MCQCFFLFSFSVRSNLLQHTHLTFLSHHINVYTISDSYSHPFPPCLSSQNSFGRRGCGCGGPSCPDVCACGDQDKCPPPPTCTCCDYQPPLPPLPPATAAFAMTAPGASTYCAVSSQQVELPLPPNQPFIQLYYIHFLHPSPAGLITLC